MFSSDFWIDFVVATLAVWRVSHLLAQEDGPVGFVTRLRAHFAGTEIGRVLDCFGCASLWVALPPAVWVSRRLSEFFPIWLALSGAAFLLERFSGEPLIVERIVETQGVISDDLLRTETDDPAGSPGNTSGGDQGDT